MRLNHPKLEHTEISEYIKIMINIILIVIIVLIMIVVLMKL